MIHAHDLGFVAGHTHEPASALRMTAVDRGRSDTISQDLSGIGWAPVAQSI